MNRRQVIGASAVVLCGAALLAVIKLERRSSASTEAEEGSTPTVVTVQTGRLQRANLHGYVDAFGSVMPAPAEGGQPPATSHVAPPAPGIVAKTYVTDGQHVEKGAPLFDLDARAAQVAVHYAEESVQRQEKLYADNNTSLRNLRDAEAQLATARAQLALLQITAPLSGTVTRVNVRPGEAVDLPTVLADITDLSRLAATAEIPSAEAGGLRPGQSVQVLTSPAVAATLTFISPTVDPANDTVLVRATLPPGGALRPGEPVRLRIVTAEHAGCLAAPAAGVVTDTDGRSVLAVVAGDQATQIPVKTGLREGGLVEVEGAGLKEGDTVVTVGAYGLPEKTKIHVVNP